MLEIKDLTYHYPKRNGSPSRQALKGINFSLNACEIVGILGPNGSGKTTLFKILSTLIAPSHGSVKIFGKDVLLEPDKVRQSIGVIFQNPSLDKKLSVQENLIHQGHLYGLHGNALKEKISRELKRYALSERARDTVETLSGGMQRRIEILKGTLHSPALLLMDEPSAGLDIKARKEMWEHLKQLKKEGITVLLTTHLIEEAERCDRLVLFNEGSIVASGAPSKIKEEIGQEVIVIETSDPQALAAKLKIFPFSYTLLANTLRVETNKGHEFIPQIMDKFGEDIISITVGKPTLEDFFIHKTGHKFV